MIDGGCNVQHVDTSDHFVETAESQLRHILAHLLGKKEKEIDYMLGLSLELLAQRGILGGDTDRASIEMALTHHDATHRNQRSGRKAELFRPEQCRDHNITAGLQLAVGLHAYAAAKIV